MLVEMHFLNKGNGELAQSFQMNVIQLRNCSLKSQLISLSIETLYDSLYL